MKYLKTYENADGITFKEWLENHPKRFNENIIDCSCSNLIDLDGIEDYKSLKYLYCYNNKLTKMPDLSNLKNLKELFCDNNKLTELPDLSNLKMLVYLSCDNNNLPYDNLCDYKEWHKTEYPWLWDGKKYNL